MMLFRFIKKLSERKNSTTSTVARAEIFLGGGFTKSFQNFADLFLRRPL